MAELVQNQKELASQFFILGVTSKGRPFRPSDWAERLCGVMSCVTQSGSPGRDAHLQFSRYVFPTMIGNTKAVIVDLALRQFEPLAFHFVLDFAKDNDLQVVDACMLPYAHE